MMFTRFLRRFPRPTTAEIVKKVNWQGQHQTPSLTMATVMIQLSHLKLQSPSLLIARCIATSSCSQSQSKFLRYNRRADSVRQADESYDDKNITLAPAAQVFGTSWFPTAETHNQVFDGIPFLDLPIIHIKSTRNNTILSANEGQTGKTLILQSAGTVGFRNARKGTNVAAQAAAVAMAGDALRKGIKTVRVCLRGLGPGRQPALKSLQMSGLNIVSITDTTRLCFYGHRPKKARRL